MSGTDPNGAARPYRALDMLLRQHAPKVAGRPPYWRPEHPEVDGGVWVPAWSWRRRIRLDDGDRLLVLDANGAYLSAISTVDVAHGPLARTRARAFDPKVPGYWLISGWRWPLADRIMSPLGTSRRGGDDTVWLTTPTVALLAQLADDGYWPEIVVHDSWTCEVRCRLRAWAEHMTQDRALAMATGADDRLAEIKLGYSQAVTLLGVDEKSRAYRPDWAAAIRAQHAATMWRKAWRVDQGGWGHLIASGSVDELIYPESHVQMIRARAGAGQVVPLRIDQTGRALGSFKVKAAQLVVEPSGTIRRQATKGGGRR